MVSSNSLHLCSNHMNSLAPYLPITTFTAETKDKNTNAILSLPHVTLTYASSLDSQIAHAPGKSTFISGPESKAMTHYLRAHHDAILVGATTAITDNPSLTSRWSDACNSQKRQPRPIVMDPTGRWLASLKGHENLVRLVDEGQARAPWVIIDASFEADSEALERLRLIGGDCLSISGYQGKNCGVDWNAALTEMSRRGIRSLMVEGGATVIHDLFRKRNRHLLTSIIVTIAPIYLGTGGIVISPCREASEDIYRLRNIIWLQMGEDIVMAGSS